MFRAAFGGMDPHFEIRNLPGLSSNETMSFDFQGFPDASFCMITDATLTVRRLLHLLGVGCRHLASLFVHRF